jgi:hypothetical protein
MLEGVVKSVYWLSGIQSRGGPNFLPEIWGVGGWWVRRYPNIVRLAKK